MRHDSCVDVHVVLKVSVASDLSMACHVSVPISECLNVSGCVAPGTGIDVLQLLAETS